MRLWVSPVPRKLRFYDLRHTRATLLRKAGVDLGAVLFERDEVNELACAPKVDGVVSLDRRR